MEIVKFKKGQVLFHQGSVADCMYEILYGQVGIYMDYGLETLKELIVLSEGDFVGELELIESSTYIATATAMDNETTLKKITIDDLNDYFKNNPAKIVLIIQQIASRIRKIDNYFLDACQTISEYRRCVEENLPKSNYLMDRVNKYSAVVNKKKTIRAEKKK